MKEIKNKQNVEEELKDSSFFLCQCRICKEIFKDNNPSNISKKFTFNEVKQYKELTFDLRCPNCLTNDFLEDI